jgi:N utilization substance protein A
MKVKLETAAVRNISIFVKMTGISPKDCIITESCIYFVIEPSKIVFAIGKGGVRIKRLRNAFGRNVKLFGYYKDVEEMIKHMIPEMKALKRSGDSIIVSVPGSEKSRVIGKGGNNIKVIKELLKRHFSVKDLKIRT